MALEKEQKIGVFYFVIFSTLIITGIVVKRVFLHPEFIMFFHVPAAVFLVLAGRKISVKLKNRYNEELKRRSFANN